MFKPFKGQVIDGIVKHINSEYFMIESGPLEAMVSYEVQQNNFVE